MISLLVAMDRNRVISDGSGLPWGKSQKADLKRFRKLTEDHTIIMGSNTYKEFDQPLPNRKHIIVSHSKVRRTDAVESMTFESALSFANHSDEEVFVIGGEQIFKLFLPYADKTYLTKIDASYNGSIHFPELEELSWIVESKICYKADESNRHDYCFIDYIRS